MSLTALRLWLLAERAKRHFSAGEVIFNGLRVDYVENERVHDAGDKVTDVFVTGEGWQRT